MPRTPEVAPVDDPQSAYSQIAKATIMNSDSYMRVFFSDGDGGGDVEGAVSGLECVQLILRLLLRQPGLEVVWAHVNSDLPEIAAREARLDVRARDAQGRHFDIEVQCDISEAGVKRARYYAAKLDVDSLASGSKAEDLTESFVVFITNGGVLKHGKALLTASRFYEETGDKMKDGSHIVYANAKQLAKDGSNQDLADVMHDLYCADPDEMHNETMARRTRQIKGSKIKEASMKELDAEIYAEGIEQGIERGRENAQRESARRMEAEGFGADLIARLLGLTEDALAGLLAADHAPATA